MLRLNKSNDTQTLAIHLDTTASMDSLVLDYSQDYDLNSGSMGMDIQQTKGKYRIGTISGSIMPDFSGQYTIDIYKGDVLPAVWGTTTEAWNSFIEPWGDAGKFQKTGDNLRTIRAYVSGSNDVVFNNYVSPNENGKYTTYNG